MMIPTLIQFGLLALVLLATLALFLSVKHEIFRQARKNGARIQAILERLEEAERRPLAPHTPAEPIVPVPMGTAPRSGMNLNKRVQAMRLLRRGEDIAHIAAALAVPRGEIELLVRVHQVSAQRAAQVGSQ
jgi:hypothetical protein